MGKAGYYPDFPRPAKGQIQFCLARKGQNYCELNHNHNAIITRLPNHVKRDFPADSVVSDNGFVAGATGSVGILIIVCVSLSSMRSKCVGVRDFDMAG